MQSAGVMAKGQISNGYNFYSKVLLLTLDQISNKGNGIQRDLFSLYITSRNFAGLSLLMSEINPENFRSISQRLAILQNNL